jgi:hypothetical protein
VDDDGDHVAHGPELARFTIDGQGEFNFDNIFTTLQNGSVLQPFKMVLLQMVPTNRLLEMTNFYLHSQLQPTQKARV